MSYTFTTEKGETVRVIKINSDIKNESQKYFSAAFNKALADDLPLNVQVEKELRERGLWDEDLEEKEIKRIRQDINDNLRLLMSAKNPDGSRMSKHQGKDLAIKIRNMRRELSSIGESRSNLFNQTVESYASNEQLQFFVYACTVKENGERYWKSFEDFKNNEESKELQEAMKGFITVTTGSNSDKKNPEIGWLIRMGFMDADGKFFVNENGQRISEEGKLIDEDGNYINDAGEKVDYYGNRVDDDGNIIYEDGWSQE